MSKIHVDWAFEQRDSTFVRIVPADNPVHPRWYITVEQRQRYVTGGWRTVIYWSGGSTQDNPEDAALFTEAMQQALTLKAQLEVKHPTDYFPARREEE